MLRVLYYSGDSIPLNNVCFSADCHVVELVYNKLTRHVENRMIVMDLKGLIVDLSLGLVRRNPLHAVNCVLSSIYYCLLSVRPICV